MTRIPWAEHITIDPELHHGEPCIRGTRIPIRMILGSLADGMTPNEICAVFPQLTPADVYATLSYAADVVQQDILLPLAS
ncbi:MAG: DUF433 domain-containing protein [Ardenticatenaceae bacterium]|nr:DUF433 domain-containing protein [Ardenticatenaceae bacterium]